jgi:hypothetical protein
MFTIIGLVAVFGGGYWLGSTKPTLLKDALKSLTK